MLVAASPGPVRRGMLPTYNKFHDRRAGKQ